LIAPFAYPAFGAILIQLITNPGRSVTIAAKQCHIGNVDGRFEFDDTSLGFCTTSGPLMLFHNIDARDNHAILAGIPAYAATPAIYLPPADDLTDSTFCSKLFTSQEYDSITLPYFHRYLLAYAPAHRLYVTPNNEV
jgi:hypothetical protein